MDGNVKKKQLVHVLHQRRQHAPRKRTSSLGFEERQSTDMMEKVQETMFKFPAPPQKPQYSISRRLSHFSTSDSDSQSDSGMYRLQEISSPVTCVHSRLKCQGYQSEGSPIPLHSVPRLLPPIGVFWDIENCQVPKGRSAVAVAEVIRKKFFTGYREAEFLVVCDVKKENNQILQELNDAQVNLIHVASMCKNAADEKLRQSMRRFADIHGSPASIVLISGDINFAADITDLRHRKKLNVILLHMENASENLILCASEHYSFSELVESLPLRGSSKQSSQPVEVLVYNLPAEKDSNSVKIRLRQLSDNCGGRVTTLKQTCATMRFASYDVAIRAQKRMDGEDVFGNKIQVSQPVKLAEKDCSPSKYQHFSYSAKKYQGNMSKDNFQSWNEIPIRPPPGLYQCVPRFNLLSSSMNQHPCVGNWTLYGTTSTSVNVAQEYYSGICSGFRPSPADKSKSTSSFQAFNVQNPPSYPGSRVTSEEINASSCDAFDKASFVMRKIKGAQTGGVSKDMKYSDVVNQLHSDSFSGGHSTVRTVLKAGPSDLRNSGVNGRAVSPEINFSKRVTVKGRDLSRSRTPTPVQQQQYDGDLDEPEEDEVLEQQFCPLHGYDIQPNRGWAEQEVASLPSVNMSLKLLAIRVHALLQSHNGSIHLTSLPQCYQAQFEPLLEDQDGVSLEHLVSCLPGIEIYVSPAKIKYLRWSKTLSVSSTSSKTDEEPEPDKGSTTPLAGQLAVFSRELIDLLKTSPSCQLQFDKFIPAYHHHFGRQCRVADYGFTKLIELLESLPHTVQVLGEGNRRVVTLSHRVQIRRFMSDLLRILRLQVNKQVFLSELADAFEKVFHKPLNVCSYGVCNVRDLLTDISDSSVVVTPVDNSEDDMLIAIPKREQTLEEIEKTKKFAIEVIDLLRHAPNFSMRFNKFIPAHHIHFGWQCRVADYGFTKLVELFEAIPEVAQVINMNGERWVCLSLQERLNVLCDQIVSLLQTAPECTLSIPELHKNYCTSYGYALRPEGFECSSMEQLLDKLSHVVKLITLSKGPVLVLRNDLKLRNIHQILTDEPNCSMEFKHLASKCKENCNQTLSLDELKYMKEVEVVESDGKSVVRLGCTFLQQQLMEDVHQLVLEAGGRLPLSVLESKYRQRYGRTCQPVQFGYPSMGAMLQAMRGSVRLRGRGTRRYIVLPDDAETSATNLATPLDNNDTSTRNENLERYTHHADLKGDNLCNNDGDSGHDDGSSTSALDVDLSLSSGSKIHTSQRSSASEVLSDGSTSLNGCDRIENLKNMSPEKAYGLGFNPEASTVWCVDSPPSYPPFKGPWSLNLLPNLNCSESPAVMLSPSANLLPAYPHKSSNVVPCSLPPLYSYPPFLPGHVASPEPSALPLPQMSLSVSHVQSGENTLLNDSNSSTPNRTKVKRRLAALFPTPLDLP